MLSGIQTESSCKGCVDRHPGCHSTCATYKAFVEKVRKEREAERRAKELDRLAAGPAKKPRR